jgi:DNA-directed RNA polymerase subunit N (RpoN/RPB10)
MITVILCMNCGKILADKWRYYQRRLKEMKGDRDIYMDGKKLPDNLADFPVEGRILDELGITRLCCRKHFLTQKDLMDKI